MKSNSPVLSTNELFKNLKLSQFLFKLNCMAMCLNLESLLQIKI